MVEILFLAANPMYTDQLRLDEEMRSIDAALEQARFRDQFFLRAHWAVRMHELQNLFMRRQPDIVHFSGHGSDDSEIILQDDQGQAVIVPAEAFSDLFGILKGRIRCVMLNACYSSHQAEAIAVHIDCVVGMSDAITDFASLQFAPAFYRALGFGYDVKTAFHLGCNQLNLSGLNEAHKPQLLGRADPAAIMFVMDKNPIGADPAALSSPPQNRPTGGVNIQNSCGIQVGGSLVGGDMRVEGGYTQGNRFEGDNVAGSKNTVGDIHGSQTVVGDGSQTISQGMAGTDLVKMFQEIYQHIDNRPPDLDVDKGELVDKVKLIHQEAEKEDPNDKKLDRWLRDLADLAPDIFEMVAAGLANPVTGAALAVQKLVRHLQRDRR